MNLSKKIMLSICLGLLMQSEMQTSKAASPQAVTLSQAISGLSAKPLAKGKNYIVQGHIFSPSELISLWSQVLKITGSKEQPTTQDIKRIMDQNFELQSAISNLKAKPTKGGYMYQGKTYSPEALISVWQNMMQEMMQQQPVSTIRESTEELPTEEPVNMQYAKYNPKYDAMPPDLYSSRSNPKNMKMGKNLSPNLPGGKKIVVKQSNAATEKSLMAQIQAIQKERIDLIFGIAGAIAETERNATSRKLPMQKQEALFENNRTATVINLLDELLRSEREALESFQKKYAQDINYTAPTSDYIG